jgi:hypothetical protein
MPMLPNKFPPVHRSRVSTCAGYRLLGICINVIGALTTAAVLALLVAAVQAQFGLAIP